MKFCSTSKTEFPSFTICPDYDVAYKKNVLEKYKVSRSDIRKLRFPDTRNLTSYEFFKIATFNLTEIVTSATIKTLRKYPKSTNYTKVEMYDVNNLGIQNSTITTMKVVLDEKQWSSETYLHFGRCFSYTIPEIQKQHGVSAQKQL